MKFVIPAFISLGLFVIASVIQLVLAFLEKEDLRRKEKFTCLLFLAFFAFFAFPDHPLIYIGALLGMLGDILDLNKKTFELGVGAFYFGHLCYYFEVIGVMFGFNMPLYIYLAIIATYALVYSIMHYVCKHYTKHSKLYIFGQSMYFAVLVTYLPILIYSTIVIKGYMFLSLIGACFFISSDSILVKNHFGDKMKRHHFYIMGTYLIAEVLIVLGFVLTLAQ